MTAKSFVTKNLDSTVVDLQGIVEGNLILCKPEIFASAVSLSQVLGEQRSAPRLPGRFRWLGSGIARIAFSSISAKDLAWTNILSAACLISPSSSLRSISTAKFRCGIPRISARNSSERIEMSGFLNPAAAKMSMTSSDATALDTIWRIACSICSKHPLLSTPALLVRTDFTAWKNATSSRISSAFS